MKRKALIALLASAFILCACGSDKNIASYKANMEQFFENIDTINESINSIDPESDNATETLLSYLDLLDKSCAQMATLEVPEKLDGLQDVAAKVSEDMTQAVALYHTAYDGEYNEDAETRAYEMYSKANSELKYIVKVLHGETSSESTSSDDTNTNGTDSQTQTNTSSEEGFVEDDYSMYLEEDEGTWEENYPDENTQEESSSENTAPQEETAQ